MTLLRFMPATPPTVSPSAPAILPACWPAEKPIAKFGSVLSAWPTSRLSTRLPCARTSPTRSSLQDGSSGNHDHRRLDLVTEAHRPHPLPVLPAGSDSRSFRTGAPQRISSRARRPDAEDRPLWIERARAIWRRRDRLYYLWHGLRVSFPHLARRSRRDWHSVNLVRRLEPISNGTARM